MLEDGMGWGGGDGESTGDSVGDSRPTTGDANTSTDGGQTSAPDSLIKLTQDQLTERLNRKGASAVKTLLQELGVEDAETLKTSLETLKTMQKEKMTAEEQVQAELADTRKQLDALKVQADAATARALQGELQVRAMQAMATLEKPFADPAAALRLVELTGVIKDGAVDADALTQAISAAAEKYPWALVAPKIKTPGGTDNPPATSTGGRTDEERRAIYFQGAGGRNNFFEGGGLVVPE